MFGLVSGFIDWYFAKTEVNILVLGLDNAGKTTFLEQTKLLHKGGGDGNAVHVPLDSILPTVGLNLGRVQTMGCDVTIWDLGGQQALRSIWDKYFADAHCIVFMVDSTDTDRFAEAASTMRKVLEHAGARGVPALVLANKQDMPMASALAPMEALFEMDRVREQGRAAHLLPLCARDGTGMNEALAWALDTVRSSSQKNS